MYQHWFCFLQQHCVPLILYSLRTLRFFHFTFCLKIETFLQQEIVTCYCYFNLELVSSLASRLFPEMRSSPSPWCTHHTCTATILRIFSGVAPLCVGWLLIYLQVHFVSKIFIISLYFHTVTETGTFWYKIKSSPSSTSGWRQKNNTLKTLNCHVQSRTCRALVLSTIWRQELKFVSESSSCFSVRVVPNMVFTNKKKWEKEWKMRKSWSA